MPQMSLMKLKTILQASKADALGSLAATTLTDDRSTALDYYQGDMTKDMPTIEGRSRAVSMDVADTIEGIMPSLMEIFTSSEEVVRFDPVGPDDIAAAEQETDYVNHVFMQKNPGFLILYSFIKDALLSKVGVVKVGWEIEEKEDDETYYDLPDDAYALLVADPDIEVVEHSEHPMGNYSPQDGQPTAEMLPPPMFHDVTVRTSKKYGCAKVFAVPPEEFGISKKARNIADANYVYHEVVRTESEMIELGYDPEQVKQIPSFVFPSSTSVEMFSRDTVNESTQAFGDEGLNDATRQMKITEHYIKLDYDGNGKARLYKVTTGGDQSEILRRAEFDHETGKRGRFKEEIEQQDIMPFAAMTPVIVTHRSFGRSLANLVLDIQRIKTALLRGLLDNAYLSNNPRVEVSESHQSDSTLDDLLVSRPGGVIRTKAPGGLNWQVVPNIGPNIYPLLEYQDSIREWRTGVSKTGQGLDANALQNQTATAANQLFTAAQARMKLIARIFAETGIRDLFYLLHAIIRKHGSEPDTVRLRGQWVPVDPRNWKARNDLTVHVGLGTGGKAEQMAYVQMIAAAQEKAIPLGIVTPNNVFNTTKELSKIAGHKDANKFFTPPNPQMADMPIPPPPDPKAHEAQASLQVEQFKAQSEQQAMQTKAQLEQQKAQTDATHQTVKAQADIALAERKFELERQLKMLDAQLAIEKSARETADRERLQAEKAAQQNGPSIHVNHSSNELGQVLGQFADHMKQHTAHMTALVERMNAPKRIVRGPDGRASHVETVLQ